MITALYVFVIIMLTFQSQRIVLNYLRLNFQIEILAKKNSYFSLYTY